MFKHIKRVVAMACIITVSTVYAQEPETENDTINTQVVNVVKPYTPTISDAFKVKEVPVLQDSTTNAKKEVNYNIFSIPVASTFTPAKGKAANVEKQKPEKVFDNYVSLGVGTYTTILGELYLNYAINRTESVGGYLSHHSSQGGIEDVLVDDDFSNTKLRVNYAKSLRDMSWDIDAGYTRQTYNWYGIPQGIFTNETLNNLDPKHVYNGFDFGGEINFEDLFVNKGSVRFNRFSDDYDSAENHFTAKATIEFPVRDELIKTHFKFDYLSGSFDQNMTNNEINYGNFQLGVSPSYQLIQDDLTVNLGVSLYFLNDTEASESKFFLYPNITASYKLVQDILIPYGGITGELIQNTYQDFASENPFVSPNLFIVPTDQQYNAFIGLKGKLSNTMSYNVRGNYYAEKNKALFKSNIVNIDDVEVRENFFYGNSFGVVYDDVDTFSILGELNVDINRNFNLGIKAEYFTYNTDDQDEAWNLPDFKASLFLDYQINEHWFAGANFY